MKIIIIGASSGIGKEMALLYAKQGHVVGITARREYLLKEIQASYPANIFISSFDVRNADSLSYIKNLISDLGGLDLFVYNAGMGEPSDKLIPEVEESTVQTTVAGFVQIVPFVFNFFVQQGKGQIAVTSSVAALRGNGLAPAYSASKAFLSCYAEGLNLKARRLKKAIIVTDIRPGFIDTKPVNDHRRFWVVSAQKAARQMIAAIEQRKRIVYITRRWWLVAQLMKILPYRIYKRLV